MKTGIGFCKHCCEQSLNDQNYLPIFSYLQIKAVYFAGTCVFSVGQLHQIKQQAAIKAEQTKNTTASGFKLREFEENQEEQNKRGALLESHTVNFTEEPNLTSHNRKINLAFNMSEKSSAGPRFAAEETEEESGETISLE